MKKILTVIFFSSILLVACTNSPPQMEGYMESEVIADFPIPEEAVTNDSSSNNPNLIYVGYDYEKVSATEGIPQDYQDAITEWGWTENEAERMGAFRVFEKGTRSVGFSFHEGWFALHEDTED
ncbi:hypothetical protein [Caldalkalibacillus salinus]|uniref:hypothetical protein n=1 Tax=Caldalkalibacillus salinus TaxID=2803787 RepID=UPI0019223CB2|nr:hypothetical protein [Caldalkalibacillus salinus]